MISHHRYLSTQKWNAFISSMPFNFPTEVIGYSVLKQPIYAHSLGNGPIKVLIWSQMHGNESTTTRALKDVFDFLFQPSGKRLLEALTLMIVPQLNPDGADAYTRQNANGVDLNRDALDLTQPESNALEALFKRFIPNFCFNLHGQRSIFSAGKNGKPATLSFLSPAANQERGITDARTKAMQLIACIHKSLQEYIPGQIGRYNDTFNPNCVGDRFTSLGVPTVLYESGHHGLDYDRNFTKEVTVKALISGLQSIASRDYLKQSIDNYNLIPQNSEDYVDLIIQNIEIRSEGHVYKNQELAIQFTEQKVGDEVHFIPICVDFAEKIDCLAHQVLTADEVFHEPYVDYTRGRTIEIS